MVKKRNKDFRLIFVGLFIAVISLGGFVLKRSFENQRCANTGSCEESLNFSVNNEEVAIFNGEKIDPPEIDLSLITD